MMPYLLAMPVHMSSLEEPKQAKTSYHSYVFSLLALVAAYLGVIINLDNLACDNLPGSPPTCYTYGSVEIVFSADKVLLATSVWTPRALRLMSLSAGIHIFGAFIFAQLMIYLGLASRQVFLSRGMAGSWQVRECTALIIASRIFNVMYVAAHGMIAAEMTNGGPLSPNMPAAIGALLIISLCILGWTAVHLVSVYVYMLLIHLRCCAVLCADNVEVTRLTEARVQTVQGELKKGAEIV